ncbi:MAG TPA: substrate-binding domain-containing protein [Thermomicrobiales bacterium]|nr:substrate-binding domain-containing protein [Thermomicrobiales bacterium]
MDSSQFRSLIETPLSRRDLARRSAAFAAALGLFARLRQQSGAQGATSLKIGWSTIYLTPSWMTETSKEIDAELERLKGTGITIEYQVFDANGDTPTQIAQVQTMIDQQYDICLLITGSATALDSVVASAHEAGVVVVNWDSLVTTDQLTAKVFEDQKEWGRLTATWLVDQLGGQGKILTVNGPAGIAVSEERAAGGKEIFDQNPGIEIVGTANIEYNEAPALVELTSLVAANPELDGIWCQAGSHASAAMKALKQRGMSLIPICGENFNGFLKQWRDAIPQGFNGYGTAELNWMAVVSLQLAVKAVNGEPVPSKVEVPLPEITNDNVSEWASDDLPDDYYPIPQVPSTEEIDTLIADALAKEGGATPAASPAATPAS